MKYDNSLFYIEKINPRPTKKFVSRFECFVALSLPFAEQRIEEQGQRRKEKSEGATSPLYPIGRAGAELRQPLRRGSTKGLGHFSPVAVPEILCSPFARRISTAATRANRRSPI